MNRFADLNFTMCMVFSILGAIIMVYGIVSPPTLASLKGLNINLWWGALTVLFGFTFGVIYQVSKKKGVKEKVSEPQRKQQIV
jgi:predicted permease